jgi:hypothetical protein
MRAICDVSVAVDEFIMFLFFFVSYLFYYHCLAVNSVSPYLFL